MTAHSRLAAVVRWLWQPRVAIVAGLMLITGTTVVTAATWPPSHATLRPLIVGGGLILRGVALPHLRRWARHLRHRPAPEAQTRRPQQNAPTDTTTQHQSTPVKGQR